jgi:hypothetical protein
LLKFQQAPGLEDEGIVAGNGPANAEIRLHSMVCGRNFWFPIFPAHRFVICFVAKISDFKWMLHCDGAGQRAGSPSERRAQFDGIGYQQEDPAKAARREQEERDRQRAEEEAEQVCMFSENALMNGLLRVLEEREERAVEEAEQECMYRIVH